MNATLVNTKTEDVVLELLSRGYINSARYQQIVEGNKEAIEVVFDEMELRLQRWQKNPDCDKHPINVMIAHIQEYQAALLEML